MALCESQLDSALPALQRERERERNDSSPHSSSQESPEKKPKLQPNGDIYGLDQVPGGLPLAVDYRSPVSHFVPPAVEMYAARQKSEPITSTPSGTGFFAPAQNLMLGPSRQGQHRFKMRRKRNIAESSSTPTPIKRKRGRPRVDKTSPEYLANLAARKQAREMAAMMSRNDGTPTGEKRKRGRPRVDKTSPEYLARKRARELEALERKAKREYRRRTTGDSAASSSAGESTPRVKRKYTKRAPSAKKNDSPGSEKVKGKRGRPRKTDPQAGNRPGQQPKIRVRSNLMPQNNETITLDSDDEPDLGSPSQASDSLSLDENLRALRHIHEKYANIDKDDLYEAHLLAANFKKPPQEQRLRDDDDVLSVRSSEGTASVKELETRVEKLEDSSNSDSDSSSSGSGSSSSGSSSSSSSSSSSDSSDSDSDSDNAAPANGRQNTASAHEDDSRSFGAWSYSGAQSDSDSDPERASDPCGPAAGSHDEISESDNESADKSFQCHICRKWYSTKVTLKIHRRGHQNRGSGNSRSRPRASDRYECDCCCETFTRREKLWEHKAAAHRGAMTVRCEVCRKCFEDDAELSAHSATHTADERAGRCSECSATFSRFDQLRRHLAVAHNIGSAHSSTSALPHACTTCGKRFGHAHSLTRHMHNHAKQLYRCVVCKASFARADQLAQHLNSHLANYKRLKP